MTRLAGRGAIVFAAGAAAAMLGLYGAFGPASALVAPAGLASVVVGAGLLLVALRRARLARPSPALGALVAAGVALHGWHAIGASGAFALVLFAGSLIPYALCLLAGLVPTLRGPALVAACVVLAVDAYAHYATYVAPSSSTAALVLLFAPLWNVLVFAPAALLAAFALARRG